jgi:hypothetical protein
MRNTRVRLWLPLLQGCVAIALMAWDIHNQHVIESVGMGWDTGAPIWPYQTSEILLVAVNAPAYVLCSPFFSLFHLETASMRYPLLFPMILAWWFWIGRRIDLGLLPRKARGHARLFALLVLLIAVTLLLTGARISLDGAKWWFGYGRGPLTVQAILLLRIVGPALWCFLLGCYAALRAFRLVRVSD